MAYNLDYEWFLTSIKGFIIKNTILITILSAVAAVLISCWDSATTDISSQVHRSTLTGKVVDKDGTGLSGVAVTSEPAGHTTTSRSDGTFSLPDIEAGEYKFHFHLADYLDTTSGNIELGLASDVTLPNDIKLTYRFAIIRGIVKDKGGTPLTGAGISVEGQGVFSMSFASGVYELLRVEPGAIKLLSAYPGKGTGVKTLTVGAEQVVTDVDIKQENEGGSVSGQLMKGTDGVLTQKRTAGEPILVPLSFADVSAMGGALATKTDTMGYFTLKGVPSGGIVVLTVVYQGDTMRTGGVQVEEKGALDLQSMMVNKAASGNDMTLTPYSIKGYTSQPTITLMVGAAISGDAVIDGYQWDIDNNGSFDTTTATGRLEIATGSTGTRYVRVQALDTAGNPSPTVYVPISIDEVKVSILAALSKATVRGAVVYTGRLAEVSEATPMVVGAWEATDVNLTTMLTSDTLIKNPHTYYQIGRAHV